MSEFEDRENEALGELPTGIQRERGELYDKTKVRDVSPNAPFGTPRTAGAPLDVRDNQSALNVGQSGYIGSPAIPASVTSVFDTRPINGRDFIQTGVDDIPLPAEVGGTILTLSYTVPEGYISALRGFAFYPSMFADFAWNDVESHTNFSGISASILVENIAQDGYTQLNVGQYATKFIPTHILALAGQNITLKLQFSFNYINLSWGGIHTFQGAVVTSIPVYMYLYGNNLQTRGLPLNFEIATQIKG